MIVQTEPRPAASKRIEAHPVPVTPGATSPAARTYWGDRLTYTFWFFCFALLATIHVFEGVRWLFLKLLGYSPAP